MNEKIREIVILGGGTAGWMSACYLKKAFGEQIAITLIEAATIPKIGVGEATIPNLQKVFFDFLGIPEIEWMRACNATFKSGIKFVDWSSTKSPGGGNYFYHLFGLIPNCDNIPLSHYWELQRQEQKTNEAMAFACYTETELLEHRLAPRMPDGGFVSHYAWHFDAHLVAAYLQKIATGWGVKHILGEMLHPEYADNGDVAALVLQGGDRYKADLFIDCSGFKSLLLNKALKEPFIDMSNYLLCDSAVAAAIPHDDMKNGIDPYTSAIAMKAGWTWKTPMLGRFGSGYVYSSSFASRDEATSDFCKMWHLDQANTNFNHIKFRTGRNRNSWVKNCVAIGLSSCFLEPLESTGIYFIYAALYQLVKYFPDKGMSPVLIKRFNEEIEWMYDDCRDFVQAHYFTSSREDSGFWIANRNDLHLSDSIKHKLETFKAGLVVNMPFSDAGAYYNSFETEFRNFWTNSSYYCIFSGMGIKPHKALPRLKYAPSSGEKSMQVFAAVKRRSSELRQGLQSNYEYLMNMHQRV